MVEQVEFSNFITKDFKIEKGDEDKRIFSGHITAEVVDRQNEFVFVKEVMDIMDTYMSINPVMSEVHSNRNVAKVLKYEQSEIEGHPSVKITGEVYKHSKVSLYDQVWDKILKGEYRGLSMGGASKSREPILKDGRLVMSLKDLELYEIAICPTPANPLAIIDNVNTFAKASGLTIHNDNGKPRIQCSGVFCSFDKAGIDADDDKDADKEDSDKVKFEKDIQEIVAKEVAKQLELLNKKDDPVLREVDKSTISIPTPITPEVKKEDEKCDYSEKIKETKKADRLMQIEILKMLSKTTLI